ncbi:hypothetical protein BVG16_04330 [Paenibacillus selenitireducens]|jgi:hypothetical protein|uniref:Uncharacterized protein n=1 Tax=Paenibacillus selenitireducens TaxID=1324314 RepID=A0A1T2XJU0_9BACL|nr:DUF2225 domain-containing protein [Paenibacillus selenitireducens]OPA79986.1 hypothetical protein BVG16_04330 [Paenibacillus selenitireducens]
MTLEPLYQIKVTCIYCEMEFRTSRVRQSLKKAYMTDSDFCAHYKQANPDFYVVRVCPNCGYASTENSTLSLNEIQRHDFKTQIQSRWIQRDYGGERNWDKALETYQLALLCAQTIKDSSRLIASLLHHIAWLYRYKENKQQEQRFLQFSLEEYIRVYEQDGVGSNQARLLYLIGELYRRIGNYHEAVKWFSRVINDKKIMDSAMIRASREQWAVLREEMLEKKVELPDEMQETTKTN